MKKILLFIFYLFYVNCCSGEVLSWVDKNPVRVGDMFNLNIEAKNLNDSEEPGLSSINGLQVLNRSEQNKTSIVGNKITRIVKWTYVLLASTPGKYKIPSLKVGNEYTNPIILEVVKSTHEKQNEIVRLDLSLSSKKVYMQQQILIRLRIIRNGLQLVNESITPFELHGVQIEKIKETSFKKVNKGIKQLITEILYVAIPEKSGTLFIPEIRYQGDKIDGVNLGSIFQKFGSYSQNRGRRIFSKSVPQEIEVLPIPDGVNEWWLPVNKLELVEKWDSDPQIFKVGMPITWTIAINVEGAYADQIPKLQIIFPEKIKSYSDKPILETKKTEDGLKGNRIEKFALIPSISGEIKLPKISIDWWDVTKGEMRTSVILEKIIKVLPNSSIIKQETSLVEENNINTKDIKFDNKKTNEIGGNILIWKILSISMLIIWIITILLWYLKRKLYSKSITYNKRELIKQNLINQNNAKNKLKKEINSGTPESIKQALLVWSDTVWYEDPPKGLEDIAARLPDISNGINKLNSVLYSNYKNKYSMKELQVEFAEYKFKIMKNKSSNETNLKKLYPEIK